MPPWRTHAGHDETFRARGARPDSRLREPAGDDNQFRVLDVDVRVGNRKFDSVRSAFGDAKSLSAGPLQLSRLIRDVRFLAS
jgi:hypothetical protein